MTPATSASPASGTQPLIQIEGVGKSYVGVRALDGISLQIAAGEIHALCGENGAGKSTLIKILGGAILPDAGRVSIGGEPLALGSVQASEAAGIAVIHQESVAFPHLNAQDNIFVGREPRIAGGLLLDRKKMFSETRSLLARLGEEIDPYRPVGELPMAQRQMVGMARALSHRCRLLIMDEPTASLSTRETEVLFRIIRQFKAEGVSILYVSHRLPEIFLLSDRVTVFRDGKYVDTRQTSEIVQDDLIRMMVGRELLQVEGEVKSAADLARGEALLEVEHLSRAGVFEDISLSVRAGEIVGMSGLVGAGRSEVAQAIFGGEPADSGSVTACGKLLKGGSIEEAIDAGIALVPEDRQHLGLVLPMSVGANISMAVLKTLTRAGLISGGREERLAQGQIADLKVKTAGTSPAAQTLSGGNQQKLVIAKWLATKPRVLILDEPTRGVDVGAKAEIYKLIRKVAAEGMAVVVISSDLPEVLLLSDRILVMREGRISGELDRATATQEKALALAMPATNAAGIDEAGGTKNAGFIETGLHQTLPASNWLWTLAAKREYALMLLLATIVAIVSIRSPEFLRFGNLRDILVNCTQPAIVACGVMLVIVTGEIDISVGSMLGLLAATMGWLVSPSHFAWPVWLAILAVIAMGTALGTLNGVLVTIVRVPSIIVTLGMLTALRGVTVILMKPGDITDVPDAARFFGIHTFLGVSMSIWTAAVVVLATFLMIRHTPIGRRIYAVGSNEHAARMSGLSVARIKIFTFALTGLLTGIATIVTQLATVNTGIGVGFELLVVTCAVVGGVSISGGVGTVAGVLLGVILLQIQSTVLIFLKLGSNASYWNKAIQGALILVAVLVDHVAGHRKKGGGH